MTASLLPNAKQVFLSAAGSPLAFGTVDFYVPTTTTRKNTWQDAAQTALNTNPVDLDAAGSALIYGSGQYRQVVKDALGNTVWDQVTGDPLAALASANTTFSGDNSFSGTNTHSGAETFTGPTTFSNPVFPAGVSKVGYFTRDVTLASGPQAVTGVGFRPKSVILVANVNTTVALSVGMDDAATRRAFYGVGGGNFSQNGSASVVIYSSTGVEYDGAVTSLDADGFTVTWTKVGSTTGLINILFMAFR